MTPRKQILPAGSIDRARRNINTQETSRKKRAYTHKGTKWKTRDKEGKPGDTPKVLDTEEEHSLLERQLGIKEKYVSLKSDIYSYHVPGTMLGVGT